MADTREKAKRDFRQEATDMIVDMLEKGTAPWQRPWDKDTAAQQLQMPHNGVTGRAYTGGNALFLMAKGMQQGYDDPRWMTYEQAQSKGWQVRKGEKATHVEFWQFDKTEKVKGPDGKDVEQRVKLDRPIQRLYAVFNAKQIDGVPDMPPQQREEWQAIEAAERAVKNSGAKLHHRGTAAFYEPGKDQITMPACCRTAKAKSCWKRRCTASWRTWPKSSSPTRPIAPSSSASTPPSARGSTPRRRRRSWIARCANSTTSRTFPPTSLSRAQARRTSASSSCATSRASPTWPSRAAT